MTTASLIFWSVELALVAIMLFVVLGRVRHDRERQRSDRS